MDRAEAARKSLHAGLSLVAAAVVHTLDPITAATVLAGATAVALAVELLRRISPGAARGFGRMGGLLKPGESGRITGATTLSMGFTIVAVGAPGTALFGILAAGLADPAASLVGQRVGTARYPGGKSVAGSAAFLVVVLIVALALGMAPARSLGIGLLLAAIEAPSLPVDDNLYLPIAGALLAVLVG